MAEVIFNSPTHSLIAKEILRSSKKRLSIVDYGCGEGELLHYLPSKRLMDYRGFEVNKSCIPVAKEKWDKESKAQFTWINRSKLPSLGKSNSVDFVVLSVIVQYLPSEDLKHVLIQAKKVLKPDGKILISCTTDHLLYTYVNIYRLFLPHFSVNRKKLLGQIKAAKLYVHSAFERGVILAPFFSNIFVFFFDALDKIMFRTKGELGPAGRYMRRLWAPLIDREFALQVDYGYTLFIVASIKPEPHNA